MSFTSAYSVPQESYDLLQDGILRNPLQELPAELQSLAEYVHFEGSLNPSVPINWRFTESVSALKAFEATMLNYFIVQRFECPPIDVTINTDHATLFFMSPLVTKYMKDGRPQPLDPFSPDVKVMFPDRDLHRSQDGLHRLLTTNIYKTKDGRFYHVHGSMNPDTSLTALGMELDGTTDDTYQTVVDRFQRVISNLDAADLDDLMNEKYRQAGTTAWTSDEYFASDHGKANSSVGLYKLSKTGYQPAAWWPVNESCSASVERPLAGLKVLDLCRVIAGPTITRSLAEMGASVMRVTSPYVTDLSPLHHDLNWGKWNCHLHLKDEADKEKLRALIKQADVVVDGYRPGVMDRLGFGRDAIFDLVRQRERGIIHVRENCYGWDGPWSHRSGWQQISDACCGISHSYSKAMGQSEAVTPVFPNSDYCTGICGSAGVLEALVRRGQKGGSYALDVSLNYYSQWLVRSCGTYRDDVWKQVWERHGSPVFRHYHAMSYLLPAMMRLLEKHDSETLFNPDFFEQVEVKHLAASIIKVKPIAQFHTGIKLQFDVGTRGNGVDQPVWPKDLTVEVVTGEN